jgi:hypothetical protein
MTQHYGAGKSQRKNKDIIRPDDAKRTERRSCA